MGTVNARVVRLPCASEGPDLPVDGAGSGMMLREIAFERVAAGAPPSDRDKMLLSPAVIHFHVSPAHALPARIAGCSGHFATARAGRSRTHTIDSSPRENDKAWSLIVPASEIPGALSACIPINRTMSQPAHVKYGSPHDSSRPLEGAVLTGETTIPL